MCRVLRDTVFTVVYIVIKLQFTRSIENGLMNSMTYIVITIYNNNCQVHRNRVVIGQQSNNLF